MSDFEVGDKVSVLIPLYRKPDLILRGSVVAYHGKKHHENLGKIVSLEDTYSVRCGLSVEEYPASNLTLISKWEPVNRTIITDTPSVEIKESPMKERDKIKSDGGPSGYYDFPETWNTFNDFIEHKSQYQWKGFSFHLGNIGKAICRWGDKGGTTEEYDAKKIIYSATRVLMMIIGVKKTREYLKGLLDDPQFKE